MTPGQVYREGAYKGVPMGIYLTLIFLFTVPYCEDSQEIFLHFRLRIAMDARHIDIHRRLDDMRIVLIRLPAIY